VGLFDWTDDWNVQRLQKKKKKCPFGHLRWRFLEAKIAHGKLAWEGEMMAAKGDRKAASHQKGRGGRSSLKAKTKLADNPFSRLYVLSSFGF